MYAYRPYITNFRNTQREGALLNIRDYKENYVLHTGSETFFSLEDCFKFSRQHYNLNYFLIVAKLKINCDIVRRVFRGGLIKPTTVMLCEGNPNTRSYNIIEEITL